jgi:hypothetical protein
LIASSKVVGCSTGNLATLSPRSTLASWRAAELHSVPLTLLWQNY